MPAFHARDVQAFGEAIFQAYGVPEADGFLVSRELLRTHLMGYESHGVVRFVEYFADIQSQRVVPGSPIQVTQESDATAVVDCGFNLGIVSAYAALEIAIAKVRTSGLAMIVTKRCNHTGRLGAYPEEAARRGFLCVAGAAIPSRGHFVVPWGGTEGRLGTNPIAYAVPTDSDPVLGDFATSVLPEGRVRAARNKGAALPAGAILDADGKETQDPNAFYGPPMGKLLPFGGPVGYKGYALSLLVELLGGTLAGETPTGADRPVNSMWLIVIDPDRFLPQGRYESLASEVGDYMRSTRAAAAAGPVRVPGDAAFARLRAAGNDPTIELDAETWRQLKEAGRQMGITGQPKEFGG